MISRHRSKSIQFLLAIAVLTGIAARLFVRPSRADDAADPRTSAVALMQTWLQEIDQNEYAQSWKDASVTFQKAITSDGWVAALNAARTPLGKCKSRKLASAMHQTELPLDKLKGDFVIAQFDSSFENLAYAIETVTFEKAPDGTWKASGYYIKPKA